MSRTTRGRRGARQEAPKPSKRQETLKVTSECAQQARRRAQNCFLSMIEGSVEPKVFIATARYINPEVYDDVVVERAVAGLCGYPMCPNTFTDTYGSRTYVIRNNNLYDITQRRNFCSNVCFEASELVRKQVLTLPLYLRDTEDSDIKDVRLPCLSRLNGRHGKLVDITGGISRPEVDEGKPRKAKADFKSVDDIALESLVNWSEHEAEQNKETEDGVKLSDIIEENENTAQTESKDTDQTKTAAKSNNSNQNRTIPETTDTSSDKTITEESGRDHVGYTEEVIESSKAKQNKTKEECVDSNQKTPTAEETGRGQARCTDHVEDSVDTKHCGSTPVESNTNHSKPATQSNDAGKCAAVEGKTDGTVAHEECSRLASPSEKQQHEPGHHKEGVVGPGDTHEEKQLNKLNSGCENTSKERKDGKEVCVTFQEDNRDSKCNKVERTNKSEGNDSVCDKKCYNSEKLNEKCTEDIAGTSETVPTGSDEKLQSDPAKKGTPGHESREVPKSKDVVVDPLAEVHKVEAVMRQWVSFDSLRVVLGDLYVRGMLEHLGHSWEKYDTTAGMRLSVEAKARYISICRRLEHEERQDEVEVGREGQDKLDLNPRKQNRPSKPLPDYSQLQRQAKKQELKVVSFFGGSDQYEEPVEEKLESIPEEEGEESKATASKRKLKTKKQLEEADTREPTLPFVDSYSQVAWRQSIVLEKVTAYLQQLLEMTRLSVHEVRKLLGPLVATFHLSPNNISFWPKQWRLITLILLKMLSVRYPIIQDALRSEEGLSMQGSILSAFSLDLGYCDRILSYLTEIQHILSKDFKDEKTAEVSESAEVLQKPCPEGEHLQTSCVREGAKGTDGDVLEQPHR
ncbi:uncharacterized protein LOC127004581 [Eriocheir sinensis]|uniref:uncharacterized protein LOC127004581 n=1 Tax=Eriocheir sinensis TaxID=95602 RepID=UPI0021C763DF|nr:uncharacterized protein LOC127004581 [Eriocheir sinensis]